MDDKKKLLQAFGQRVRSMRVARNWSQEELADRCGYESATRKSTVSKIENGQSDVPLSKLMTLAEVFGVSPSQLLSGTGQCEMYEPCHEEGLMESVRMLGKLDMEDRAEIRGEMKQMLRNEKYTHKKECSAS